MPVFAVGRSRTRLGSLSWRVRRRLFAKTPCGYILRVSNYYDIDEHLFKSVLLHEMIHLYVVSQGIKDTSPHGVEFRRKMDEVNADGWNVSVSVKTGGWPAADTSRRRRRRTVLAVEMKDGRRLLSVVVGRYVKAVDHAVRRSPDVASLSWHVSCDDYFAGFPAVRTPRGRVVSRDVYDKMLSAMEPLDVQS